MRVFAVTVAAVYLCATLAPTAAVAARKPRTIISKRRAKKTKRKIAPSPKVSGLTRAKANETVEKWLSEPLPIENPTALATFYKRLRQAESGEAKLPVRVLQYGDSHTAADEWTGTLRTLLQAKFGDGGNGYSHAGRPWNSYRRIDLKSYGSQGWYSDGLVGRQGDGLYGLSGVSLTTSHPHEYVRLVTECSSAELMYLQHPEGGEVEVIDNGQPVARFNTRGEQKAGYYKFELTPGPHELEARTLDSGKVRLFGWVTEKDRGVTYETMGINGATAPMMLALDQTLFAEQLLRRDPALIVLAFGTNEAGHKDWTRETYREAFQMLLNRIKLAAPEASVLVVGPPDRQNRVSRKWVAMAGVDMIAAAQREAALNSGCAFWDLRRRMGGPGSIQQWIYAGLAQADHVHLTGTGYKLLGNVMYKELTEGYKLQEKAVLESAGTASYRIGNGSPSSNH